ncbi:MAG TPA: SOS response-associated peptidase family protein, partial [Polyangiaceae bacterium]|nr:SOS response-associated peptidase family protein [Polyangiaceae bacterium]
MCGRYTNEAELSDIRLAFDVATLELFRDWKPTYNITPGYGPGFEQLFVVGTREGQRALRLGRFWLLPPGYAGPRKGMPTTFNARSEELAQKPLWK